MVSAAAYRSYGASFVVGFGCSAVSTHSFRSVAAAAEDGWRGKVRQD